MLYSQALSFINKGWSVIPLAGGDNSHMGKRPPAGFYWKNYQSRLATVEEIQSWFEGDIVGALGIVCGAVSRLAVLEFDDANHYEAFTQQYPHLTNTYTVLSGRRKLPHLYFHTEDNIPNRDWKWGSLRSKGKYVVSAGSTIAGNTYQIINDCEPQHICYEDICKLIIRPQEDRAQQTEISTQKAIEEYKRWAPVIGRNNALYKVTKEVVRRGNEQIEELLIKLHTETRAFWQHTPETPEQRSKEAHATIKSAAKERQYRRPIEAKKGIPNKLRETLIKTDEKECIQVEKNNNTPVGYSQKVQELCEKYNITDLRSDPLPEKATQSACAYRMAMHQTLIMDRPGQYGLDWLAERLGVTRQTIRNYNERLGIQEIPVYNYVYINWENVDDDLYSPEKRKSDGITPGYWLQDENGQRWPSIRGLAAKLLKEGRKIIAVKREPNIYCFPDADCFTDGVIWRCKQTGKQHSGSDYNPPPCEVIEKPPAPKPKPQRRIYTMPAWALNLTLIKGIGLSRQYILEDMGIHTIEQLVTANAEKLARFNWPGGYVTAKTIEKWISDGLLLLGRRTLTDEEIAQAEQKRLSTHRKQVMRGFLKFIQRINQNMRDPTLERLEGEIAYFLRYGRSFKFILGQCIQQIHEYLDYIDGFLSKSAQWLYRWCFDDHKTWRKLRRMTINQLEKLSSIA